MHDDDDDDDDVLWLSKGGPTSKLFEFQKVSPSLKYLMDDDDDDDNDELLWNIWNIWPLFASFGPL